MRNRSRSIVVPATALAIGVVMLGIDATQGTPPLAMAIGFSIIVMYGALVWVFQNRSETVSVLAGRPSDERWLAIHERALAVSAVVAVVVALVGFGVVRASGGDYTQFLIMAVVLGVSYLGGLLVNARRI